MVYAGESVISGTALGMNGLMNAAPPLTLPKLMILSSCAAHWCTELPIFVPLTLL